MANAQLTLTHRTRASTASAWRTRAVGLALGLWRALEAIGQARARRELRALASGYALSDPARAELLRAASDSLRPR